MSGRPITDSNAKLYIENVSHHGIDADTRWIVDEGRFPVGARVLDVGSGTGSLANCLGSEEGFFREVHGIELSPDLVAHARNQTRTTNVGFVEDDFLAWQPPASFRCDTMVMSFYLHHCDDHLANLQKASSLLPHGGRLYVFDRVAKDRSSIAEFQQFWNREYRSAHEWKEEQPNLCSLPGLIETSTDAGLRFVREVPCPHDRRPGTENFPKTLVELWRQEPGQRFPAIALVSPAHQDRIAEIVNELSINGLQVAKKKQIDYSSELILALYEHCPWKHILADFVEKQCPLARATALVLKGDSMNPELLQQLTRFKKLVREKWKSIKGPKVNGMRPMILPFHVAESHESVELASLLDLEELV